MKYAGDITAEDKADFLQAIYEGQNRAQAAEQLDSTGTQFRRLCNPLGEHFDADFAEAYRVAILSEQHEEGRLEEIRDLVWDRARRGDTRMIEKLALIYDPDWRELRHQNLNVNVQMVARMLPHISTAELERALAELEAEKPSERDRGGVSPKPHEWDELERLCGIRRTTNKAYTRRDAIILRQRRLKGPFWRRKRT